MMQPKVGAQFRHETIKEHASVKGSPGALMKVTQVRMHWVHFRYANPTPTQEGRPGFGMDRAEFVRTYPEACEEKCPECYHTHTPDGCTGDPSPSDIWAGVTPEKCDCDEEQP